MRRYIIPIFLLAAVALSTGVVLPRLKPLQPGPDPVNDQSNDQPTECEVLRKLYNSKNGFVGQKGEMIDLESFDFGDDNKQENYNEHVSKRHDWSIEHTFDDSWLSYLKLFSQHQDYERNYLSNPYDNDAEPVNETPDSNVEVLYARNKDILIRDDDAYYVYDTYVATRSPFDYVQNKFNCLYKAMSRTPYDMPPNVENIEMQDEPEKVERNDVPAVTQVAGKRFDASDEGEKEIPDNLEFNEGNNGVQKKLFSFWSRLQALSHKGRQLPTRRHTFVYYGNDGTRDGALTAETRASHLRPPGQPLRWG